MRPRAWMSGEGFVAAAVLIATVVLLTRDQGGYFPPSWGWSGVALAGVVVTWLVASARTDAGIVDGAFLVALLGLTAWVGLSIAWSVDRAQSVLELERGLVLLAGCATLLVLGRRGGVQTLIAALLTGIAGLCAYSLSTRLAPTAADFNANSSISHYRLFTPIGYWNGLGLFAVLGILLALALVTEPAARIELRILASVSLVVLPLTLFFTFSRGGWLALAVGLLSSLAVSPHRLRLVTEGAAAAALPAVSVALAWHAAPLTNQGATLVAASRSGHHLAFELLGLAVASIAIAPLLRVLEGKVRVDGWTRRAVALAVVAVVAGGLAAGVARAGGPSSLARRAYHSFADPGPPPAHHNLTNRLASLNGNGRPRMWSVAIDSLHGQGWALGNGAGSFERVWDHSRRADEVVRDAHGLYVETLSELGLIGLGLLVVVLSIPLLTGLRRRTAAFIPALTGAYLAFLAHLAVDWDWELSGVALTGLFVGCLLLIAHRQQEDRPLPGALRAAGVAAGIAATGFAFVGLTGNTALAQAQAANGQHRYGEAVTAATRARRWMPWSPAPLQALGTARLEQGRTSGAQASFRAAISLDPNNWQSWLDLAASVHSKARARAVAHARALYPRSPEIAEFEKEARPDEASRGHS